MEPYRTHIICNYNSCCMIAPPPPPPAASPVPATSRSWLEIGSYQRARAKKARARAGSGGERGQQGERIAPPPYCNRPRRADDSARGARLRPARGFRPRRRRRATGRGRDACMHTCIRYVRNNFNGSSRAVASSQSRGIRRRKRTQSNFDQDQHQKPSSVN